MLTVIKYNNYFKNKWDSFIDSSKNGTFLFKRDFIEYHSDRFTDFSLMILNNEELMAVLPANINETSIFSHQGLTYGGLILRNEEKFSSVLEYFKLIIEYAKSSGIESLIIKQIPFFYCQYPSFELDWILFKLKAELYRRDISIAIDLRNKSLPFQERRIRAIKKAQKSNLKIVSSISEYKPFWENVLEPNLLVKHSTKPVHSIEEIEALADKFPNNIKQYNVYVEDKIVAGTTLFINKTTVHAQYISSTEDGRRLGCLDFLFNQLIKEEYASYNYFDFGICNENDGQIINKGLLEWKEGFGARTYIQDFYKVSTKNLVLLEECYL